MTPKILRLSETTISKPYFTDERTGGLVIIAEIYSNLSSIVGAKTVRSTDEPDSPYQDFINDMQYLEGIMSGTPDSRLSAEDEAILRKVDIYLGSLGLTEDYPITKDKF